MAGADLPTLDVRPVWHDTVPPQAQHIMRLIVERVLLVYPHQLTLFRRIGLVQHHLIEVDRLLILKSSVLLGEYRWRLVFADVEHRVDDALAVPLEANVEIAAAQRLEP